GSRGGVGEATWYLARCIDAVDGHPRRPVAGGGSVGRVGAQVRWLLRTGAGASSAAAAHGRLCVRRRHRVRRDAVAVVRGAPEAGHDSPVDAGAGRAYSRDQSERPPEPGAGGDEASALAGGGGRRARRRGDRVRRLTRIILFLLLNRHSA